MSHVQVNESVACHKFRGAATWPTYAADVSKPVSFYDFKRTEYPITFELWAPGVDRSGPPTWTTTVTDAASVEIPGLGRGTWGRITFGDGRVEIATPPGEDPANF